MLHLPRIMLAAPASGSGKTMITCGLLQTLKNRGMEISSFKCGPDYIDPMFHTEVIGAKSRNLDPFFTGRETVRYLFAKTAAQTEIAVVEGVMGLFDGLGGTSAKASSYDLAGMTDTPVILVVNARGMSLSVIPLICGYLDYQKRFGSQVIRGVILNQMSKMTYLLLKDQIEEQTGIKLYGYVPRLTDCTIESRHLGLVTPDEVTGLRERLDHLSRELEQCLDMEGILALAESADDYDDSELQIPLNARNYIQKSEADIDSDQTSEMERTLGDERVWQSVPSHTADHSKTAAAHPRLAVAKDEAFCFYYQDNLDLLESMGAEIVPFSPLHDAALPQRIDGLLLGGGYPELYAGALSQNETMKASIREAIRGGMPYLAECGGFMYLHDTMEDMEGHPWPMCGCIQGQSFHTPKLSRFGYITLQTDVREEQLLARDQEIRGHEFHYFDSTAPGRDYQAKKPTGRRTWECIHGTAISAAGYPHLYYWSNPDFAYRFVQKMREYHAQD